MKVALLAHGTRGDVQPAVAVADRLAQRGHRPVLCVNADLAGWAGRSGHRVVASDLDVGGFLSSPQAREVLARGRVGTLVRRATVDERRVNDSIIDACLEATQDADVVVSTLGMALRGAVLARSRDMAAVNLFCAPLTTTGEFASMGSPVRNLRSAVANRWSHRAFHALLWRGSRANVNDLCDRLGAPRPSDAPSLDAVPTVHAYSGRLVPRPRDWPDTQQVVGPALPSSELGDRLDAHPSPRGLAPWLSDGPPVVYFGLGSMPVLNPGCMLATVATVTANLGLRALVAAGATDYSPDDVPDHVRVVDGYLDHARVLPHCVAAVHHGGAGTTATVSRTGIPSVVLSVFLDQPFWGWRLAETGLGVTLPFRRLTASRLNVALSRVLEQPRRDRAQAFGSVLDAEDGAAGAAELIEQYALEANIR
jgi:sterol 3beta-glucosyltransferase